MKGCDINDMDAIYKVLSNLGWQEYAIIVLILSIFIDISPKVKWNPIKSIINYFGKWFNNSIKRELSTFKLEINSKFNEIQDELQTQRKTLDKLVADQDNKELSRIRWEITDFENSIMNGTKHSREQYRHVLDDGAKYKRMMESLSEDSGDSYLKFVESLENIKTHYEKGRQDQSALFF